MSESTILFKGTHKRLLLEISKRQEAEFNSALREIYEELGIKEEMDEDRKSGKNVIYKLLPDYSGIVKIVEDKEKKE